MAYLQKNCSMLRFPAILCSLDKMRSPTSIFLHHGEYVNIKLICNILACLWLWLHIQEMAK